MLRLRRWTELPTTPAAHSTHNSYSAPRLRLAQHTPRQQVVDVAQRGVGRALGDGGPFAAGELAVEAVEQTVEQLRLLFVEGCAGLALPEAGLVSTASRVCA
jgi:hypothetical protein